MKTIKENENLRLFQGAICHDMCAHFSQYHGISKLYAVNMNDTVFVQLTEKGREKHKQENEEFYRKIGLPISRYSPPRQDSKGFSQWQLHDLMRQFGDTMQIGSEVPFRTTIYLGQ